MVVPILKVTTNLKWWIKTIAKLSFNFNFNLLEADIALFLHWRTYAAQLSAYAAQPTAYAAQPSTYAAQPTAYAAQPSAYAAQP